MSQTSLETQTDIKPLSQIECSMKRRVQNETLYKVKTAGWYHISCSSILAIEMLSCDTP